MITTVEISPLEIVIVASAPEPLPYTGTLSVVPSLSWKLLPLVEITIVNNAPSTAEFFNSSNRSSFAFGDSPKTSLILSNHVFFLGYLNKTKYHLKEPFDLFDKIFQPHHR